MNNKKWLNKYLEGGNERKKIVSETMRNDVKQSSGILYSYDGQCH
jgi:hypothetical protein